MRVQNSRRARLIALFVFVAGIVASAAAGDSERLICVPTLQEGQKFVYRVRYKTHKVTRSESRIATPLAPEEVDGDTGRYVAVEVKKVQGSGSSARLMLRTQLLPTDGTARASDDGVVEFTLLPDGRADALQGFSVLDADEQALWRQWVAQFALGWTFPAKGVKPGEKWKTEEPVVGAALAKLVWEKEYQYVRQEACPPSGEGEGGGAPEQTPGQVASGQAAGQCAVVVTTSTMKQHGSHDEATPDDYKQHLLKTSGAAQGKTDVLTFISLKTRMLERANEDSAQTLDVVVAKADDSNKAHFNVEASSHAEVTLVQ